MVDVEVTTLRFKHDPRSWSFHSNGDKYTMGKTMSKKYPKIVNKLEGRETCKGD